MTNESTDHVRDETDGRPFNELRHHGLLWLINRCVFHPRGFALAFHGLTEQGEPIDGRDVTGWSLVGDGSEPWAFDPSITASEDDAYAAAEALFAAHRSTTPDVVETARALLHAYDTIGLEMRFRGGPIRQGARASQDVIDLFIQLRAALAAIDSPGIAPS